MTIEQIQQMITDKGDQREIINELVDYIQANLFSLGGSGYLVYNAKLSQTGTNAPSVQSNGSGANTPFNNTLGGDLVWTRSDVGYYIGTLAGAFPIATKVQIIVGGVLGGSTQGLVDSADSVSIETFFGGDYSDDLLSATSIEIRIWQ